MRELSLLWGIGQPGLQRASAVWRSPSGYALAPPRLYLYPAWRDRARHSRPEVFMEL